jgi:HK97 family phage major capsid protein
LGSVELIDDLSSWTTFQGLLESSLGKRLSRIQNKTWLTSLIASLTANSSASVASELGGAVDYNDIITLASSVNAEYRYSDKAAFLFNSTTQRAIGTLKDSQGHSFFPNVMASRPTLLEYPVYISDFADNIAATKNPILFGDFSYVFTRAMAGFDLQILKEQFITSGYIGTILRKRADMQYAVLSTADSAIKMLHT